jgi:hypothetical protein
MSEQLESISLKQAVKVASNLRLAATLIKRYDLVDRIDGADKGSQFVKDLQAAIYGVLTKNSKTISLKKAG